jgi:hypothetical protein
MIAMTSARPKKKAPQFAVQMSLFVRRFKVNDVKTRLVT